MGYFIALGSDRHGPFPPEQLVARGMQSDTLVWRQGMAEWLPADQVEELRALLMGAGASSAPPRAVPPGFGAPPRPHAAPPGFAAPPPQYGAPGSAYGPPPYYSQQGRAPSIITVPMLISAIFNCFAALGWTVLIPFTCGFGIIVAAPLIVLLIFEFMTYSELNKPAPVVSPSKVKTIAICEIVAGGLLFSVAPLVCGIIILTNLGRLDTRSGR